MGRYADNIKKKEVDALLNGVTENDKIESLKELLNLFSATDDGNTKIADVINAAIDAKITAAIGTDGAITTWADARYAAKTE